MLRLGLCQGTQREAQCLGTCDVSGRGLAMFKSSTERTVSLSTTEAETYAGVTCVQDMLYMKNVLESLGLWFRLPMVLEMDN
jgi:hypothetical protein